MAIARPNADFSIGAWTDQSGGTASLFPAIGEAVLNLSTRIQVVSAPLAGDPNLPATFGLSAAPSLGAGEQYLIGLYADAAYAGGPPRALLVELLDGSTVEDQTTLVVTNTATPLYTYQVMPTVSSLAVPRLRFTLMHDGTDWQANVYMAWLGYVFPHLALGVDGWPQVVPAAAGSFLTLGADGSHVVHSGLEDETALILAADGWPQIHG